MQTPTLDSKTSIFLSSFNDFFVFVQVLVPSRLGTSGKRLNFQAVFKAAASAVQEAQIQGRKPQGSAGRGLGCQATASERSPGASFPGFGLPGGCASSRLDHGLKFYVIQGGCASSRLISGFSDCVACPAVSMSCDSFSTWRSSYDFVLY